MTPVTERIPRKKALKIADEELNPIDIEILHALYRYKLMSLHHVGKLFFNHFSEARISNKVAGRHISKMERLNLLVGRELKRTKYVYLSTAGMYVAAALENKISIRELKRVCAENLISSFFLKHHLEVVDVAIAFESCQSGELAEWSGDKEILYRFKHLGDSYVLYPDGRGVMWLDDELHPFYLELDRGRKVLKGIEEKLMKYLYLFLSDGYLRTEGNRTFPPVLLVVPTLSRKKSVSNKALTATLKAHMTTQEAAKYVTFAVALLSQVTNDPLADIWDMPLQGVTGANFNMLSPTATTRRVMA